MTSEVPTSLFAAQLSLFTRLTDMLPKYIDSLEEERSSSIVLDEMRIVLDQCTCKEEFLGLVEVLRDSYSNFDQPALKGNPSATAFLAQRDKYVMTLHSEYLVDGEFKVPERETKMTYEEAVETRTKVMVVIFNGYKEDLKRTALDARAQLSECEENISNLNPDDTRLDLQYNKWLGRIRHQFHSGSKIWHELTCLIETFEKCATVQTFSEATDKRSVIKEAIVFIDDFLKTIETDDVESLCE